ncbi:MAG: COX15/CtaA family protein, partial [Proteobacteria bacterium]|nr:COX15/CtaA family protein [Pseudomonadota bacterium]
MNSANKIIVGWLVLVCFVIFAMIVVGGVTRLTHSGLSMVDWKPIMGFIPPLNDGQWAVAFDAYKQYPEYRQVNKGMSLDEFKNIFYWEYGHRVLSDKDFRIFDSSKPWPHGRPIHGDFDKISSESGVMWKAQASILEDWQGPQKTTTTNTPYAKPETQNTTAGNNSVKTTKKNTKVITATSSKVDDDAALLVDAKVIEVEINTGE